MVASVQTNQRFASSVLVVSFFCGYFILKFYMIDIFRIDYLARIWLLLCVLPLLLLAYNQNCNRKSNADLNSIDISRIKSKVLIILLQLTLMYSYAFLITRIGLANYFTFTNDLFISFPIIFILIFVYVYFVDRRLPEPKDEYALIGAMLKKTTPISKVILKRFALKTIVKIVFIPFMYSGFLENLIILLNTEWYFNANSISLLLFNFGISIDMLIGIFGYLFSSAIINNQIKDTDSNLLGWIFALLCYPPLVWIMHKVNNQQDSLLWSDIIPNDSLLFWLIFLVINATWVIYWLATFEFGMTFSNLSWRRLIDKGVYRYTKHPAYIAKNFYWWSYTLPFMGVAFLSLEWWGNPPNHKTPSK